MMMSHHNDLCIQQSGLFDDDVGRISRAEMLFYREITVCKLSSSRSEDRLCERGLSVRVRISQAIRCDTVFAAGRQRIGWIDNA